MSRIDFNRIIEAKNNNHEIIWDEAAMNAGRSTIEICIGIDMV